MLRGVNVGGHNRINMTALRALYESLKFADPRTYVQSGKRHLPIKGEDLSRAGQEDSECD
jgi:Protein of unknown function (DUF1697)